MLVNLLLIKVLEDIDENFMFISSEIVHFIKVLTSN